MNMGQEGEHIIVSNKYNLVIVVSVSKQDIVKLYEYKTGCINKTDWELAKHKDAKFALQPERTVSGCVTSRNQRTNMSQFRERGTSCPSTSLSIWGWP